MNKTLGLLDFKGPQASLPRRNAGWKPALILILTLLACFSASAQYPQQYQMGSVENLAWQIENDTGRLLQAVEADRHGALGITREGAARIEDLRRASSKLLSDIRTYGRNPVHTGEAYKGLVESWALARPFVAALGERPGTRTPAGRIDQSMQTLGGLYAPVPTAAVADWKLRQIAADILRLTGGLADRARLAQIQGQTDPYTANQFEKLSAASYRFFELVRSEKFDSRLLGEAYADLVSKFQGARDVAGRLNLMAQTDLATAWGLASQLAFISPNTTLGEFAIHDFYR